MLSESALNEFARRCNELLQQLAVADVAAVRGTAATRLQVAMVLASAYVWSAAALEMFVRQELALLAVAISNKNIKKGDARRSLLALLLTSAFDGLSNSSGMKAWRRRVTLLEETGSSDIGLLNPNVYPVDRKTLKAEHFETIWAVYGFGGSPLPSQRHALALKELSNFRNELAHGQIDPLTFGRTKTYLDARRTLGAVEDIASHLHIAADAYLQADQFRRP
jgi:hypothetical protein